MDDTSSTVLRHSRRSPHSSASASKLLTSFPGSSAISLCGDVLSMRPWQNQGWQVNIQSTSNFPPAGAFSDVTPCAGEWAWATPERTERFPEDGVRGVQPPRYRHRWPRLAG